MLSEAAGAVPQTADAAITHFRRRQAQPIAVNAVLLALAVVVARSR
ncbi:hypothetical protein ABZ079_35730 [Streptomyces sp. NPDC006314]